MAEQFAATIPSARITFCGSGKSFERRYVTQSGFNTWPCRRARCPTGIARRWRLWSRLGRLFGRPAILRQQRVAAVVGLGGYASVSMSAGRHPTASPADALNRCHPRPSDALARAGATLVCTAFEAACDPLRGRCPVRRDGKSGPQRLPSSRGRTGTRRQLVILGDSGGGRSLNTSIPAALYKVRDQLQGWRVLRQSGEAGLAETWNLYGQLGLDVAVVPLSNMPAVLSATDLVVCRAGGTALAELAVAGTPAVLLPYPHATDDHQRAEPRALCRRGRLRYNRQAHGFGPVGR